MEMKLTKYMTDEEVNQIWQIVTRIYDSQVVGFHTDLDSCELRVGIICE